MGRSSRRGSSATGTCARAVRGELPAWGEGWLGPGLCTGKMGNGEQPGLVRGWLPWVDLGQPRRVLRGGALAAVEMGAANQGEGGRDVRQLWGCWRLCWEEKIIRLGIWCLGLILEDEMLI